MMGLHKGSKKPPASLKSNLLYQGHCKRILDRTQSEETHPVPGMKLKFLTPPGIEPGPPGWKAGTQADHATATDLLIYVEL